MKHRKFELLLSLDKLIVEVSKKNEKKSLKDISKFLGPFFKI